MVYGVIGWGVLGLGGIAVLVAELFVVRQRTWFFGLMRVVGARRAHVAAIVLVDVATVLLGGLLVALALAVVTQPIVAEYVETAFGVRASLLDAQTATALLLGGLFILVIAALPPALRAVREEPIRILEQATN